MAGENRFKLSLPLHIFLREVVELAKFYRANHANVKDDAGKVTRHGLESARLPADLADTLLALQKEAQALHTDWILVVDPNFNVAVRARSEFVLGEIMTVVDYHLDDGVEDDNDKRLTTLVTDHAGRGESHAALALALEDFTALALPMRAELDGLIGFDAALLDEAPGLAEKLRALPVVVRPSPEAEAARLRRDAKLAELYEVVRRVRRAARAVFRAEPDLARQATSAWERMGRAERARAARRAEGTE